MINPCDQLFYKRRQQSINVLRQSVRNRRSYLFPASFHLLIHMSFFVLPPHPLSAVHTIISGNWSHPGILHDLGLLARRHRHQHHKFGSRHTNLHVSISTRISRISSIRRHASNGVAADTRTKNGNCGSCLFA